MLYPQEVIQDIRVLNDIVDVIGSYIQLRPRGGSYIGLCPFHNEKTASFSVSNDRQMFHCFGCHAGGNVISFVMRIENMDFIDSIKLLADRVHYNLPDANTTPTAKIKAQEREKIAELNKQAARYFHEQLQKDSPEATLARSYLEGRGVHISLQKRFGLGLAPPDWDGLINYMSVSNIDLSVAGLIIQSQKNQSRYYDRFRRRLMFPIIDSSNRIVGFGGRALPNGEENEAKYINSPDTPLFNKSRQLYGLNIARKTRNREFIIVEGYMDVLALHQAGFTNTVGVLGTALTAEHVRLLKRSNCETVTLILDSDEAGVRAVNRAIDELLKGGFKIKVLQFTPESKAKDPDEYLRLHGQAKFSRLLTSAKSHIAFQVTQLRNKYSLNPNTETNQRIQFTHDAASLLAGLSSEIEIDAYAQEIAAVSGITALAILSEVQKQRANLQKSENGQAILPTIRRNRSLKKNDDRGLVDAKKGLLNLVLTFPIAAKALRQSGYLDPEEIGDETYSQLLVLAFKNAEKTQPMSPADIIATFEDLEDQQKTAEIFADKILYNSDASIEKALNDMVSTIKQGWFTHEMDVLMQKNDLNAVNKLFLSKRNTATLYITMNDG